MNDLIDSSDLKRFVPALAFVLIGGAVFSAVNAGAGDFTPLPVGRVPFAEGAVVEDQAYGPVRYWQMDAIPVPARPSGSVYCQVESKK